MRILKLFYFLVVSFVVIAIPLSANDITIKDIKQDTKELVSTIKNYSFDKKEQLVKKSEKSLEKLDKRIDNLESKVDKNFTKMSTKAKEKSRETLKELRKQRVELAENLGQLKSSSLDAWQTIKNGFEQAYKRVELSWQKAEKELENVDK